MAYVKHFRNDVFISYAHNDNTEGWVDNFAKRLHDQLVQIGLSGVAIWRDKKLNKTDVFSDEIFDQLKQSALLVSIVSPSGMRSNWCQDERQKFEVFAEATGGFRIGNAVRAVKIVKTPEDGDRHRALFGTLGFEFYTRDDSGHFVSMPFSGDQFQALLETLAQELKDILDRMNARPRPTRKAESVYLALCTPDLEATRVKILDELADWGFEVLPQAGSVPIETPGFRHAVATSLAQCSMSVHLVSEKRGVIPDEEQLPVPVLQYEMAATHALQKVVWIEPEKKPHESFQTALESRPQQALEILKNYDVSELKQVLEEKLKSLAREPVLNPSAAGKLNVYLICAHIDNPYAPECSSDEHSKLLESYLGRRGYTVWLPPVTLTEKSLERRDHEQTLDVSDAVVLYWGHADEIWFREKLRELTTAQAQRSHRPFRARAIYLTRPAEGKDQYKRHLDMVIAEFAEFKPEQLGPLEQRLQKDGQP